MGIGERDRLKDYHGRRHFERTPEPEGGKADSSSGPMFVVQKHDASRLHYDFRLEAGGVLKSWAVPKGPSMDPAEKRLAAQTEDHPLEYAAFEGVIPEGEYGAGPVIVWDAGRYRNLTTDQGEEVPVEEAMERGHLKFRLQGSKLKGTFALTRTRGGPRPSWIMVKMRDDEARPGKDVEEAKPESILTGRTVEEVEAGTGPKGKKR